MTMDKLDASVVAALENRVRELKEDRQRFVEFVAGFQVWRAAGARVGDQKWAALCAMADSLVLA